MLNYWVLGWILYRLLKISWYVEKLQTLAERSTICDFLATLLTCPFCFGTWFALLTYIFEPGLDTYLYFMTPVVFAGLDSLVENRVIIFGDGG